jgi:hypothetical protein
LKDLRRYEAALPMAFTHLQVNSYLHGCSPLISLSC